MDLNIDLSILEVEPADQYHTQADRFLSSHQLLDFIKCPWLHRKKTLGLIEDPIFLPDAGAVAEQSFKNRGMHLTPPTTTCRDPSRLGRHTCNDQDPWKRGMGPAVHPDAIETCPQQDGWPNGDVQGYKCPHCGLYFEVELPQ